MTTPVGETPSAGAVARPSLGASSPRYGEKAIKAFLFACAALSILVTTLIVLSLVLPSLDFFQDASIGEFLTGSEWSPNAGKFGVLALVSATLSITVIALLVAIPVGLLTAIYLSEYAHPKIRRIVKPVLEVLAGIPTVAIGLFAVTFMRPLFEDILPFLDWSTPFSIGVAGVAVGLMIVPLVASVSEDAMRAVPAGLRQGAYALGATRLRVSMRVVFPAAISGVVASVVLAASRAIGETMVVLMAAGASAQVVGPWDFTEPAVAMTGFIGIKATGDSSQGTIDYTSIFAVGLLLFVMTLIMNMIAIRLVRRFREVYE